MTAFLDWLSQPRTGRGVSFADDAGGWHRVGYPELAGAAAAVADRLVASGVRTGDVVAWTALSEYSGLAGLFGIWLAGGTACPIAPPSLQPEHEYVERTAAILDQAEPVTTLTTGEFAPLLAAALGRDEAVTVLGPDTGRDIGLARVAPRDRGRIALLQFTSGSTSRPQGVRVSWDNLDANLPAIRRTVAWRDGDGVASWLPLYHDMGLIGCLYAAVSGQSDLWLMKPAQFIRDPARWLECFLPGRARTTAVPSFAFGYLARRVPAERIARMDLSQWRCVAVGSEVVDVAALEAFARHAAPAGFTRAVYSASYGLAENTLAVTSSGPGNVAYAVRPEWTELRFGEVVPIAGEGRYGDPHLEPGAGWLLGHGGPQPGDGIEVRIVGDGGEPLPDGCLGEITVTGTSVADGYLGSAAFGGVLRTGDAGFVHRGQLFVLGRMGESLSLRGRNVYVEELDAKVAAAAGLNRNQVATVATTVGGRSGVAVFAEKPVGPWTDVVTKALRGDLGPDPTITIVAGRRGLIKRTTSGKPRRRHLWQLLHGNEIRGATIVNDHNQEQGQE
jgi:acyl-CoA synthetase (AMP-forming)/AMP-acid ligase II